MSSNASPRPSDRHTIAVTGVNGFVGKHLVAELNRNGNRVIGIGKDDSPEPEIAGLLAEYHSCDLRSEWPQINNARTIVHLAGLASVKDSFSAPQDFIETNSAMITTMCENLLHYSVPPRVIGISSGAVYDPHAPSPLSENSPVVVASPYVVSKLLVESQLAYYRNRGLDSLAVRPFNHSGPGQGSGYLLADLIQKTRDARDHGGPIKVGNLHTSRDYTDVRDVAAAYRLLAVAPQLEHPLYNVCSGRAVSGDTLFALVRRALNADDVGVEIDTELMRPTDADYIMGDASRIENELGWKPSITIENTISDLIAQSTQPAPS